MYRNQSTNQYRKAAELRRSADAEALNYHKTDAQDFLAAQNAQDNLYAVGASEKEIEQSHNASRNARAQNHRKAAQKAGTAIIDAVMYETAGQVTDEQAKEHYEENKGAYHELAAMEAHMDGVEINIDQAQGAAEAINVKVMPSK